MRKAIEFNTIQIFVPIDLDTSIIFSQSSKFFLMNFLFIYEFFTNKLKVNNNNFKSNSDFKSYITVERIPGEPLAFSFIYC
jgi:hypothetical protein